MDTIVDSNDPLRGSIDFSKSAVHASIEPQRVPYGRVKHCKFWLD